MGIIHTSILAIGGGENLGETASINERIVALSKKKEPKLLFLPTASGDAVAYFDSVNAHFSQLGCICTVLYLIREKPSLKTITEKVNEADIIYVGGGNTYRMMRIWKKSGLDKLLKKAHLQGTVMCGLSAGAICWFSFGNSDSRRFNNPDADLIKVTGLGLVNALYCPHYDVEEDRKPDLKRLMQKTSGIIAIAVDNCCAIEIVDDTYRIIDSKENANAYKVYWKSGKFIEEKIEKTAEYKPLVELLSKKA